MPGGMLGAGFLELKNGFCPERVQSLVERDRLVNTHCEKCCRVLGEHREKASSSIVDGENRKSFKEETTQAES